MATTIREIKQGATRIAAQSFSVALREDELLVSAATLSIKSKPSGADDLTLGSPTVLSAEMEINGEATALGEGITFSVEAATDQAPGLYVLHGTVTTDSVPAEVIPYDVRLLVRKC